MYVLFKSRDIEQVLKVDVLPSIFTPVVLVCVHDCIGVKVVPTETGHDECGNQHHKKELTGSTCIEGEMRVNLRREKRGLI